MAGLHLFGSSFSELADQYLLNSGAIIDMNGPLYNWSHGGELAVQEKADTLGAVIKNARMEADITMEALAERIGVTERYLYRIENEGKKPSYDVLKKLIRELAIQPDLIFYPEKPFQDSEAENLIRMLCNCDERSVEVVKATAKALIGSAPSQS